MPKSTSAMTRISRAAWACILSALLYGTVSSLMTFCNKALSSSYDFGYPLFLLWVQMVVTQIGLLVMYRLGLFVYPSVTARSLLQHLPVASFYVLNASLAISSLQGMSIPTYGVLKRAGPLFILGINVATARWFTASAPAVKRTSDVERGEVAAESAPTDESTPCGVVAGVVVIVVGALVAGHSDLHLSPATLQMALASNLTQVAEMPHPRTHCNRDALP